MQKSLDIEKVELELDKDLEESFNEDMDIYGLNVIAFILP